LAYDPGHDPEDLQLLVAQVDGLHRRIGRLQPNPVCPDKDGDIIIVEQRQTAENGESVVAMINGERVTLKRFYQLDPLRMRPDPTGRVAMEQGEERVQKPINRALGCLPAPVSPPPLLPSASPSGSTKARAAASFDAGLPSAVRPLRALCGYTCGVGGIPTIPLR